MLGEEGQHDFLAWFTNRVKPLSFSSAILLVEIQNNLDLPILLLVGMDC